ncbi:hypothetical protein GCM10010172_31670 [Paractinoplanes ferrugineus]|uniref:Restriction endonuclease type IV Mrr domain-containing protein n=1 Tax=Paractinoplanes ferrugineus TaxID=113564 RepID=A0A919J3J6_9ACTN|nr:restriction endonuclease [Actinoplanes ferrugineus]GIE14141.1 hypothetical protein Afe05nite_59810 [Actinoplanes ferrugineus]
MAEYDFRTLSPSDFEQLVRDLLLAENGWTLETFGHGRDGGVDLRGVVDGKKLVVQCKHYAGSTFSDLRKSARKEVPKMKKEKPDRYLFVTSQALGRTQKDTLAEDLDGLLLSTADIHIQPDLNEMIGRHPEVERANFKLWLASASILDMVMRSGLWARSESLLEDVSDRVKYYVSNPGYIRADRRLHDSGVVILSGVPGVGKSMLAEMLLLNHWHQGWQVVAVSSDIDEAWESIKPSVKQIFLYDDFLGQTDISERNKNEDSRLIRFMHKVYKDPAKRLVMTTRSQILNQAALVREPIARGDFRVRECVVMLSDYGPVERARILYNHLYFSELPRFAVREYAQSGHYWEVIRHPNFSPRIIEQVLRREAPDAKSLAQNLGNALDRPVDLWRTMFATVLSDVAQRIVISLVIFPVEGTSPEELRSVARQDASPVAYTNALKALEGTFISIGTSPSARLSRTTDKSLVSFANPSVRDFVLAFLDEEPDYVEALIRSATSIRQLVNLLQYAASESGDRLKFPETAASIATNSGLILDHIQALIAGASEIGSTWQVARLVLDPLSELLAPAAAIFPADKLDALIDETRALINDRDLTMADGGVWERFVRAEVKRRDQHTGLQDLLVGWGQALETVDDVENFGRFLEELPLSGEATYSRKDFATLVEAALENDIDNISDNRRDEDDDLSWLSQIEEAASDFGILEQMSYRIESERDSIVGHYADKENEFDGSMPTSGGGYFGSAASSAASSQAEIEGMFSELS